MLWAATAYFNPQGYRCRLANYREFRSRLDVPLLAVELGFNGCFELDHRDADVLVQIDEGDVLWQKERLLNVGLAHLPGDCEAVLSIDCDVLFLSPGWLAGALNLLERYAVVQPYSALSSARPHQADLQAASRKHFNPQGYRCRLANYREFRSRLDVPLLAVELGFNGCFELDHRDADVLVQIDEGDVLWQKERLLNVGLAHLPGDCEAVLSIDCDVLFLSPGWLAGALNTGSYPPSMTPPPHGPIRCIARTGPSRRDTPGFTGASYCVDRGSSTAVSSAAATRPWLSPVGERKTPSWRSIK